MARDRVGKLIDESLERLHRQVEGRRRTMTPAKARRAIDAIVACLECDEIDGSDRVALEDARAALGSFERD